VCTPDITGLPAGIYTVEFGVTAGAALDDETVERFDFPEGRYAARVTAEGQVMDISEIERLDAVAGGVVPETASWLDRVYGGRLRLVAYQLDPAQPQPGDKLTLTLYWQPVGDVSQPFVKASKYIPPGQSQSPREIAQPVRLIVQLSDSRSISLGRDDSEPPINEWPHGQVSTTQHHFALPSELDVPLAGRVEVTLLNELEVPVPITTITGESQDTEMARFTIAPETWPGLPESQAVGAMWQNEIRLLGYSGSPAQVQPGETLPVSLFWETQQPVVETYVVFVHLVDEAGQIKAQNDSLPRAGAYPIPWWQPGQVVEDVHPLVLPEALSAGVYQLIVGLYRPEDGARLQLSDGRDSFVVGTIQVQ
jgi:hypothetical protein